MRWVQAWMLLALSTLVAEGKGGVGHGTAEGVQEATVA
jgi:hypothetical protein